MRTTVALLEARPATVADDYRRLLALADLPAADGPVRLIAAAGDGAAEPGRVAPAWLVAACLERSAPGGTVFPVAAAGGRGRAPADWSPVLAAAGAAAADPDQWDLRRVHPHGRVPGLEAVLPAGLHVPAGLQAARPLLAAVPTVGGGWPVAGATALLLRLLAPRPRRPRRLPLAELLAEAAALAAETMAPRGAVLDATVWHVVESPWRRSAVGRNILLAGADPVAVDAVACRLAGAEPRRVPWLRLCSERGVGEGRPDRIRLVGQTELLDLDFALPQHTLVAADRLPARRPLADLLDNLIRRPARVRGHRPTPWGRLHEAYGRGQKA
ncbi:MAG TPA: DUF362 domain-containing protein [Candidatus Krumholzibacteria bacterium]|nr:DUF362 domain-containing protein [Candidatus Krumholzibacteria bacterium]